MQLRPDWGEHCAYNSELELLWIKLCWKQLEFVFLLKWEFSTLGMIFTYAVNVTWCVTKETHLCVILSGCFQSNLSDWRCHCSMGLIFRRSSMRSSLSASWLQMQCDKLPQVPATVSFHQERLITLDHGPQWSPPSLSCFYMHFVTHWEK